MRHHHSAPRPLRSNLSDRSDRSATGWVGWRRVGSRLLLASSSSLLLLLKTERGRDTSEIDSLPRKRPVLKKFVRYLEVRQVVDRLGDEHVERAQPEDREDVRRVADAARAHTHTHMHTHLQTR